MAQRSFVIIAHRGFSSKAPENTIAAFDMAINSGFTNMELDVQLSSDGIPVVIHDPTLERTTTGRGYVKDSNAKVLLSLDAGSWFSDDFAGQHLITLRELLTRYADKAHLHIELKSDEIELPSKVAETLKGLHLPSDTFDNLFEVPGITITSFKLDQLQRSLTVLKGRLIHSWLVDTIDERTVKTALKVGVKQLCPRAAYATEHSIELALSNGLTVRGHSVKTDEDIRRLYATGALGATTNWPDRAKVLLGQ